MFFGPCVHWLPPAPSACGAKRWRSPCSCFAAEFRRRVETFLTAVNGGGVGGPNDGPEASALHSDVLQAGPWEVFHIEWLDQGFTYFALRTLSGNYVTAVNGGGMGGPNDWRSPFHTDATQLGEWETFSLYLRPDSTVLIRTLNGQYVTAVNGGGFGEPNTKPIHTDATRLGPWERFLFVPLSGGESEAAPDGDTVQAAEPPPPLPAYDQPPCPEDGYIWTPGYWSYAEGGYFWVPGTWVQPPQVGLLWTPGYWGFIGGRYGWHGGYWGSQVGFYGGINYGFGYGGIGFEGGRWAGNRFSYNTAVTNVDRTIVHNTYINNVTVNNVTVNNTSFNGGPRGVSAKPTAQESLALRHPHIAPTPLQQHHILEAAKNPALSARANGGHPTIAATPRPAAFNSPGVVRARGAPTQPGPVDRYPQSPRQGPLQRPESPSRLQPQQAPERLPAPERFTQPPHVTEPPRVNPPPPRVTEPTGTAPPVPAREPPPRAGEPPGHPPARDQTRPPSKPEPPR